MQKARGHPLSRRIIGLPQLVSDMVKLLRVYLALPDGAGGFPQGVSDPVVLRILLGI